MTYHLILDAAYCFLVYLVCLVCSDRKEHGAEGQGV
jgi:hypothetical protein